MFNELSCNREQLVRMQYRFYVVRPHSETCCDDGVVSSIHPLLPSV